MVNAGMVNAGSPYFLRATFCQKNRDSGRFLYFKNTVKYTRNFPVNHRAQAKPRPNAHFIALYQWLRAPHRIPPHLMIPQGARAKLAQYRKAAQATGQSGQNGLTAALLNSWSGLYSWQFPVIVAALSAPASEGSPAGVFCVG